MLSANDMIKMLPKTARQEMVAPRRDFVWNCRILTLQEMLKPIMNA
jgi:hypothetical protein